MKTLAIKHNSHMNYARQFGYRFLTGGWYRQMVIAHYHRHMTYVNICRVDDVFPYDTVRRAQSVA